VNPQQEGRATARSIPWIGRNFPRSTRAIQGALPPARRNNPLFVGEAGVGKDCDRRRACQAHCRQRSARSIGGWQRLFSLDMGTLLAGTRYRGDFRGNG